MWLLAAARRGAPLPDAPRRAPPLQGRAFCSPPPSPQPPEKRQAPAGAEEPAQQGEEPRKGAAGPSKEQPSTGGGGGPQKGGDGGGSPSSEGGPSKEDPPQEDDGLPPGFERWYPSNENPDIPVAKDERKKKVDKLRQERLRAEKERERKQSSKDEEARERERDIESDKRMQRALMITGAAFLAYCAFSFWSSMPQGQPISWQQLTQLVMSGAVGRIEVYSQSYAEIWLRNSDGKVADHPTHHMRIGDPEAFEVRMDNLQEEAARYISEAQKSRGQDPRRPPAVDIVYRSHDHSLINLVWQCSLPLLVMYFLLYRVPRMQKQMTTEMFKEGKGQSKFSKEADVTTKFKDVAGMAETKQEIVEVVDFLKAPARYHRLGAKIPKGVLLTGPPGVGKTLLARATAGESGVPFFSVAGSDFMEIFVGVGPSRVRELFEEARKHAPCIVFVDEIDAIGRKRQTAGGRGRDSEQESTLNAILVEMDGFNSREGVVVLAGTNRHDILDKALLRPGRFDRQIAIDKPPLADREEIFMVHLAPLTLHEKQGKRDVAKKLATLTPGFSGADIMNVCNEAALIAARRDEPVVTMHCFELAIEKIVGGLEKPNKKVTPKEKRMVSFHEAGHVVCGWFLKHVDPILKVSIVPRGSDRLGYTQHLPRDKYLYTQEEMHENMVKLMGGRAAEHLVFGEVSTGAAEDMNRITQLATQQITKFGFSIEKVGHVSFPEGDGNDIVLQKPYSQHTERLIDAEVRMLVEAAYERALNLLTDHREKLDKVGEALLEREALSAEDLTDMLGERPHMTDELRRYMQAASRARNPAAADAAPAGAAGGSGGPAQQAAPPAAADNK